MLNQNTWQLSLGESNPSHNGIAAPSILHSHHVDPSTNTKEVVMFVFGGSGGSGGSCSIITPHPIDSNPPPSPSIETRFTRFTKVTNTQCLQGFLLVGLACFRIHQGLTRPTMKNNYAQADFFDGIGFALICIRVKKRESAVGNNQLRFWVFDVPITALHRPQTVSQASASNTHIL